MPMRLRVRVRLRVCAGDCCVDAALTDLQCARIAQQGARCETRQHGWNEQADGGDSRQKQTGGGVDERGSSDAKRVRVAGSGDRIDSHSVVSNLPAPSLCTTLLPRPLIRAACRRCHCRCCRWVRDGRPVCSRAGGTSPSRDSRATDSFDHSATASVRKGGTHAQRGAHESLVDGTRSRAIHPHSQRSPHWLFVPFVPFCAAATNKSHGQKEAQAQQSRCRSSSRRCRCVRSCTRYRSRRSAAVDPCGRSARSG